VGKGFNGKGKANCCNIERINRETEARKVELKANGRKRPKGQSCLERI